MTRRPRITLVGPLPPLRGGIPRHTEGLRDALARHADLQTIPMRRLYPRWIFPGETLHEPDEAPVRRPDSASEVGVDALDPRTWATATRTVMAHRSARVLIPWWTVAVAPMILAIARSCRRAGVPVTFLCHNVVDHESAWWKRAVTRTVLREGDRFQVASGAEAERIRELLGVDETRLLVYPHPVHDYLPAPDAELPRRHAREFLFFGIIRPYKGLDMLVDALARMPDDDWQLTVAGEPWMDLKPLKERARAAGIADRIEWVERYVPQRDLAAMLRRADVVVLPYRRVTGSAVLAIAIGAGKSVVATAIPGLREMVRHGETGWLVSPDDVQSLADTLASITATAAAAMTPAVRAAAASWTWNGLAEAILASPSASPRGAPIATIA